MNETVKCKWERIYSQQSQQQNIAALVLTENAFLLPEVGNALDLACGLGANALFLAQCGLSTDAWDISSAALDKLSASAHVQGLNINTRVCDISEKSLLACAYDVIVVSRFLDRSLSDGIIDALNPGGLLFYQTFTREKSAGGGPHNPDYLLAVNELLQLFAPLRVVLYRELGVIGKLASGLRNEAQYIGQKL